MELLGIDFSIFTSASTWISLVTLIFLEIILGVDNLVFIAITTNRLPEDKQHIGRKLGLAGALVMRILFLCFASVIIQLSDPLFHLSFGAYSHGISVRDLVLLAGGAYLIYKGIAELRDVLHLTEIKAEQGEKKDKLLHQIGLPQAVLTIMVMDVVFSIDSVITAVAMADHLIVMIIAVMIAVAIMILFIDPISEFINNHPEMKILALVFIVAIGLLLVLDALGIHSGLEPFNLGIPVEKLLIYFAMIFSIILELIQMRFNRNYNAWRKEQWKLETADRIKSVRDEMVAQLANEAETGEGAVEAKPAPGFTPVFIGSTVYIMMPIEGADTDSFREMITQQAQSNQKLFDKPIELSEDAIEVEGEATQEDPTYEVPGTEK